VNAALRISGTARRLAAAVARIREHLRVCRRPIPGQQIDCCQHGIRIDRHLDEAVARGDVRTIDVRGVRIDGDRRDAARHQQTAVGVAADRIGMRRQTRRCEGRYRKAGDPGDDRLHGECGVAWVHRTGSARAHEVAAARA